MCNHRRKVEEIVPPHKFHFRKENLGERLADVSMISFMYALQLTACESPQDTHAWNWRRLPISEKEHLITEMTVTVSGNSEAGPAYWCGMPLMHMPKVPGGWKKYHVLMPRYWGKKWYLGWLSGDTFGVSALPNRGACRALIGPEETSFFALTHCGKQIPLSHFGKGEIGQGGPFCQLPLR